MAHRISTSIALALAATLVVAGSADAQTRKARPAAVKVARTGVISELSAPPLTVRKRSFLDPGNVVAPGSETPEYIAANTTEHVPVYRSYNTAFFGESELPGRFDLPNNPRFFPQRNVDFSPF